MHNLRRFLWLLIAIPTVIVLIALAVANRQSVQLILDPFSASNPAFAIEAPLFLLVLLAVGAGVLLGGIVTWFGQGKWRKSARREHRDAASWKREAERLEQRLEIETKAANPALTSGERIL